MATKYFDRNGTTAGFGTLTGTWNTTTASWTDSTAGTATPTTYTFTDADIAQFGRTGTTATGGTATISTGVTVTLNGITAENLTNSLQNVTYAGTGNIVVAGTSPTFTTGTNGALVMVATMSGTAGFTKEGPQILYLQGGANSISGVCTINAGSVTFGTYMYGSPAVLPNITSYAINNTDNAVALSFYGLTAATISQEFAGTASTAVGIVSFNPGGITLSHEASCAAWNGYFQVDCANTSGAQGLLTLAAFPLNANKFIFANNCNSSNARTNRLVINGNGGTSAALIDIYAYNVATPASTAVRHALVDNSTGPTYFTGGALLRAGSISGALQGLELNGSNTNSNFDSVIDQSTGRGTLQLHKEGTGKWTLTGTNTYTSTTFVWGGTLAARNAAAFGAASGSAVTQTAGTIEIGGGINLNKAGSTVTLVSVSGADAVYVPDGDNTLTCAGIPVGTPTNWDVASGAKLTLANSGAMSGSGSLVKLGDGELDMGTFANTFDGTTTISAGKLTAGVLANGGTASSLGDASSAVALTGTLAYAGTANTSTNRSITFTGSAPALESNGTGHVDFTACTQASGARTIGLGGSNTGNNKLSPTLADGTGTVGIQKYGAGKWQLTGTLSYTGTTTVNAGTLDLGDTPRTLSSGVTMAGGTMTNGNNNTLVAPVTMTGGTMSATLTSTSTVDVDSGTASLYPLTATGSNSHTGATVVDVGAILQLFTDANPGTAGQGKVTGDGNVTVNGYLKTGAGTNQRGQARYGGNLTFASGSKLYIGAAA